ncbi:MAG: hypothetical protein EAX87_07340 [Candidatus Thorarchaeota archaeon]|nr:hypothetical protein [Candidatus Thorarchaeota archaeon]
MMNLKLEDFGLLHPIYPKGTMKFKGTGLMTAKTLKLCPNCLLPGNIMEHFGPFVVGMWRVTIPISTHRECSSGWSNRNISGSTRVWAESGYPGYICFDFKNPVYAMLFSRINFQALFDGGGRPLTARYDDELARLRRVQRERQNKLGTCPRCKNDLYEEADSCPSCGLSRKTSWVRMTPRPSEEVTESMESLEVVVKCAECGTLMLKEPKLKNCGKCGSPLKDQESKEETETA